MIQFVKFPLQKEKNILYINLQQNNGSKIRQNLKELENYQT